MAQGFVKNIVDEFSLTTGSSYPITSSWAVFAVTASSASYAPGSSAANYTSSLWGTASWANNANTASMVQSGILDDYTFNGGGLRIGGDVIILYPNGAVQFADSASYINQYGYMTTAGVTSSLFGTASWADKAVSASFAPVPNYTSSLFGTASWAAKAVSASFAPMANYTSSLFGTASWATKIIDSAYTSSLFGTASRAISASFAPAPNYTSSLFGTASWAQSSSWAINAGGTTLSTGSTYQITASWAETASFSNRANSASYATTCSFFVYSNVTQSFTFTSQSNWSSASLSSSWASSSMSSSYNTYLTGSATASLFGTASWARQSQTSSYVAASQVVGSLTASYLGPASVIYVNPGDMKPTTNDEANLGGPSNQWSNIFAINLIGTASWDNKAVSASFAPVSNYTSSLFGTASWANKAVSASFAPAPNYTSSLLGTASWADKAVSASYAPGSVAATYTSSLFGTASWAKSSSFSYTANLAVIALGAASASYADSAAAAGNAISASYASTANNSFTAISATSAAYANLAYALSGNATGSVFGTASWATKAAAADSAGTATTAAGANSALAVSTTGGWVLEQKADPTKFQILNLDTFVELWQTETPDDNELRVFADIIPDQTQTLGTAAKPFGDSYLTVVHGKADTAIQADSSSYPWGLDVFGNIISDRLNAVVIGAGSPSFGYILDVLGNTNIGGNLNVVNITGSKFTGTASYADSSSYTPVTYTSSLWGTASWAHSASFANSASFARTASWASQSLSSSYSIFARTSSYTTGSIVGSLFGTASWASFASQSFTSSYSMTGQALYATSAGLAASATSAQGLQFYPIDITRSVVVDTVATNIRLLRRLTSSFFEAFYFRGATYDYAVRSQSNARAGKIVCAWTETDFVYSDNSTADIGNTNDIYVFPMIVNTSCSLFAYTSGSLNWTVSAVGTYI